MSSDTVTVEKPPEQLDNDLRAKLIAKFGKNPLILADGFTTIPNRIIDRFAVIGMTPTEYTMFLAIIRFQYGDADPWPGLDLIANKIGRHIRTVERYIKRLEQKGFLRVTRGELNPYGSTTNQYDFTPFYDKLIATYAQTDADKAAKKARLESAQNITNSSTNITESTVKPPVEPPPPDNLSGPSFVDPTKLPTELGTGVSPKKESKNESLQSVSNSNFRSAAAQTEKGTDSESSHGYTNPTEDVSNEENEGNVGYDNQSTNNAENENRNRKPTVQNELPPPPPPPAWSKVPILKPCGYIKRVTQDFSDLFHDENPKSSWSQCNRIFQSSSVADENHFGDLMYEARTITSASDVHKKNQRGRPNRMPYFFVVLKDLVAQWEQLTALSVPPLPPQKGEYI